LKKKPTAFELRKHAEEVYRGKKLMSLEENSAMSPVQIREILHELRVHQIELEIQNEELRQTQASLETAHAQYFDLYELAPVGYFTCSKKGVILEANLAAANLLGVPRKTMLNQPLVQYMSKAGSDQFYLNNIKLSESGETQSFEQRIIKPDGSELYVIMTFTAAKDETDSPVARITLTNITPLKHAAVELEASRERIQLAIKTTGVGIWEWNILTNQIKWDEQMFRIYGVAPTENGLVEYRTWSEAVLPEELPRQEEEMRTTVKSLRVNNREFRIRRINDGVCCHIQAVEIARLNINGQVEWVVGTNLDITERYLRDEKLRQLSRAVEQSPVSIVITDLAGAITYVNPRFTAVSGYSQTEAIGKKPSIMKSGETPPELYSELWKTIMSGREWRGEFHNRKKSGELFWEQALILPIVDEAGKITHFLGVLEDISARKQVESEIKKLHAELEQRVLDRTAELTLINKELESFSYSISHDLRAPLRRIDGFSQILQEDCVGQLDAASRANFKRIREASQHMSKLIDDLLNLSSVGRGTLRHERVNLSALAQTVADHLQQTDPSRRMEWVIAPDQISEADPGLMQAMMENLLGNAWKFTSKTNDPKIEFGRTTQGGEPAYFIRDNGAGFDMRYAGKMFGAFQRMHTTAEFAGTGIGLATVQRILHRHKGRIWAESKVGSGATFYFTLPDLASKGPVSPAPKPIP